MVGVGDKSLRMKDIATDKLPNGHCEIRNKTQARDPDAGVVCIRRSQIGVSMVVVMVVVAVTTMASRLRRHERKSGAGDCGGSCWGGQ